MTLSQLVVRNALRNKRRSILTVLSIMFSLLLLTIMMTIWRSFYIDPGPPDSSLRLMTRHRVSLAFFLPGYYREKIRAVPGVTHVVPLTYFGGRYKDDRPENFFVQFATDPEEYMQVAADKVIPEEQVKAWQRDRTGCIVDAALARRHGWKIGDRITLLGTIFPANLDLTIRGIYSIDPPNNSVYFNTTYLEESVSYLKGTAGFYFIRASSPEAVSRAGKTIDEMFRNSPQPTRSETEQAFRLGFIATLGNVKAFILSIGGAVVFAILLVCANTMAMSVRERTREVAVLKTLGFTSGQILWLFLEESVGLCLAGGMLGILAATGMMYGLGFASAGVGIPASMKVTIPTMVVAIAIAAVVGLVSTLVPSYYASRTNIVEGLRHIG